MRKTCFKCGCHFDAARSDQLFCSKHCRYKYYHNSDLVLILKGKWFDMILSGEKTEEYRAIKPYWEIRFNNYFGRYYDCRFKPARIVWGAEKKDIVFKNGYQKNARQFTAECTIREDVGREGWGANPNEKYYVITIHRIFDIKNCDKVS